MKCNGPGCGKGAVKNAKSGKCTFHSPLDEKDPEVFWIEFEAYLKRVEEELKKGDSKAVLRCRGFIFPDMGEYFIFRRIEPRAVFSNTVFTGTAGFIGTEFVKGAEFERVKFIEGANFSNAKFGPNSVFEDTDFEGERATEFMSTIFNANVKFMNILFKKHTMFKAEFKGNALFEDIEITDSVSFSGCRFWGGAEFVNLVKRFRKVELRGFKGITGIEEEAAKVAFNNVSTRGNNTLIFKKVDLGEWRFAESEAIETAVLVDVTWRGDRTIKRNHTGDEKRLQMWVGPKRIIEVYIAGFTAGSLAGIGETIELTRLKKLKGVAKLSMKDLTEKLEFQREAGAEYWEYKARKSGEITYGTVADVYRRLRVNYEKRLAYEAASDFHIGQMEMMLKDPKTNAAKKFFLCLYKLFSNYGENVNRPVYWLSAFTGIAALALVFSGFPENNPVIKWERVQPLSAAVFDWRSYFLSHWDGIKAAWYAFTSLVSFRADPELSFEGATVIKTLYRIFAYPLITLFILALRRAFRR